MGAPKGNDYAKDHDGSDAGAPPRVSRKTTGLLANMAYEEIIEQWPKLKPQERRDIAVKIVIKTMPQNMDITSLGERLVPVPILGYVQSNNSDKKDSADEQPAPVCTGGNVSQ